MSNITQSLKLAENKVLLVKQSNVESWTLKFIKKLHLTKKFFVGGENTVVLNSTLSELLLLELLKQGKQRKLLLLSTA